MKKIKLMDLIKQQQSERFGAYGHTFEIKLNKIRMFPTSKNAFQKYRKYPTYDIYVDGKKIGYAIQDEYTGKIDAKMWGKSLPNLNDYTPHAQDVISHFKGFILNNSSGKKWLEIMFKHNY